MKTQITALQVWDTEKFFVLALFVIKVKYSKFD